MVVRNKELELEVHKRASILNYQDLCLIKELNLNSNKNTWDFMNIAISNLNIYFLLNTNGELIKIQSESPRWVKRLGVELDSSALSQFLP